MKSLIHSLSSTLLFLLLLLPVTGCSRTGEQGTPAGISIHGTVSGLDIDTLYLHKVIHEHYDFTAVADTLVLEDGHFTFACDTLAPELFCLSTSAEAGGESTYLFLTGGANEVNVTPSERGGLTAVVEGSVTDADYRAMKDTLYILEHRQALDSLDELFYAARSAGNLEEMARLKEESAPLYAAAEQRRDKWYEDRLQDNGYQLFDLYLFYSHVFQNVTYDTLDDINALRTELEKYSDEAKASAYYPRIIEGLDRQQMSAIGATAPEIVGTDREGHSVALSDFRGKYVLIDFWRSNCGWCLKEMPTVRKTYETFRERDFTVLGVSSDLEEEPWIAAIDKEGSTWDNIRLTSREAYKSTFSDYSILGIPFLVLVGPDGTILAKGMRGESIYSTVEQFVTK